MQTTNFMSAIVPVGVEIPPWGSHGWKVVSHLWTGFGQVFVSLGEWQREQWFGAVASFPSLRQTFQCCDGRQSIFNWYRGYWLRLSNYYPFAVMWGNIVWAWHSWWGTNGSSTTSTLCHTVVSGRETPDISAWIPGSSKFFGWINWSWYPLGNQGQRDISCDANLEQGYSQRMLCMWWWFAFWYGLV